jgi:hypothetical protein
MDFDMCYFNICSSFFNQYSTNYSLNFQETIFDGAFWEAYFFMLILSLNFSIPTMFILGFIIKLLTDNKFILIITSVICIFITFYLVGFIDVNNLTGLIFVPPIIYSTTISILIWIIPLIKSK